MITRTSLSKDPETRQIIGIDGEGWNIPLTAGVESSNLAIADKGHHSYVMLAAADDNGFADSVIHDGSKREAIDTRARNYGLTTTKNLDFLLNLPDDALLTSFAFSYDTTKISADLPFVNLKELSRESVIPEDEYKDRVVAVAREFDMSVSHVINQKIVDIASTVYENYWIRYTPRKQLVVTDLSAGYGPIRLRYQTNAGEWKFNPKPRNSWYRSATVWDSFGFFQKPFVGALNDYRCGECEACHMAREHCKAKCGICAQENYCRTAPWTPADIEHISVMKENRGAFKPNEQKAVLAYCLTECRYLSFLMRDLIVNIKRFDPEMWRGMNRYDGSGAVASAWNKTKKIKEHLPVRDMDDLEEITLSGLPETVALYGYFGGRFEISEIGYMGDLFGYDINSAYPAITTSLPCLAHGEFMPVDEYVPGKFGVYLVGSRTTGNWAPFPFRTEEIATDGIAKSAIYYAHGGKRWIWSNANESLSEIAIARKHFGKDSIPVYEGYVWESTCNHQPFKDIPAMYKERQEFVLQGNGIEKVIKLILNSLYGKTAQSIGWKLDKSGNPEPPPFQCFIWAGLITSGCRAMILDALMQPEADVVSIATDGILSRTPINLDAPKDKILGKWEASTVEDGYLFQSGVYTYLTWDKWGNRWKRTYKTRGFSSKEIPAEILIAEWKLNNRTVHADPNHSRFIPMRSGVNRTDYGEYIGQWIPSIHDVSFNHNRRLPVLNLDEFGDIDDGLERYSIPVSMGCKECDLCISGHAELCDNPLMSAKYTPKQSWEDVMDSQPVFDEMDFPEVDDIDPRISRE